MVANGKKDGGLQMLNKGMGQNNLLSFSHLSILNFKTLDSMNIKSTVVHYLQNCKVKEGKGIKQEKQNSIMLVLLFLLILFYEYSFDDK